MAQNVQIPARKPAVAPQVTSVFICGVSTRNIARLDQAIPEHALDEYILPPISLQLLMENAIKHNAFSRQNVLVITLQLKENMLVFSNNITKKRLDRGSNGIGLTNLRERYGIVTGEEISVSEENNAFTVGLPLLKLN